MRQRKEIYSTATGHIEVLWQDGLTLDEASAVAAWLMDLSRKIRDSCETQTNGTATPAAPELPLAY